MTSNWPSGHISVSMARYGGMALSGCSGNCPGNEADGNLFQFPITSEQPSLSVSPSLPICHDNDVYLHWWCFLYNNGASLVHNACYQLGEKAGTTWCCALMHKSLCPPPPCWIPMLVQDAYCRHPVEYTLYCRVATDYCGRPQQYRRTPPVKFFAKEHSTPVYGALWWVENWPLSQTVTERIRQIEQLSSN